MTVEHRFGPFRFSGTERVLYRDGEPVPLMPKAVDTLAALLERRGQVVEKAELLRLVWPDCTVEEIGLARNISLLRKALGDDGETYIETVPKRGYRFRAAEAEAVAAPALPRAGARWWAISGALAVLIGFVFWQFYRPSRFVPGLGDRALVGVGTLEVLSPELERTALGRGLADTLAAELGKSGTLQLVSPGTVHRYERLGIPTPLMARVLGLDAMVEGTAQQFGPQVRVTLRLSDVHSGRLLWSEGYDGPVGDLAGMEQSVARAAAEQIGKHLIR